MLFLTKNFFAWFVIGGMSLGIVSCKTISTSNPVPLRETKDPVGSPVKETTTGEQGEGEHEIVGMSSRGCTIKDQGSLRFVSPQTPFLNFKEIAGKLELAALRQICEASQLVVFVGNGDQMGSLKFSSPYLSTRQLEAIKAEWITGQTNFHHAIEGAARDIRGELTHDGLTRNECLQVYQERGLSSDELMRRSQTLLLRILDGPQKGDSKILATLFNWQDGTWKGQDQAFAWDHLQETLTEDKGGWELHVPSAFEKVLRQLLNRFPGPNQHGAFDHHVYIFKTHGGLYTQKTDKTASPLLSSWQDMRGYPVLLFDLHHPEGERYAQLASPFWSKSSACKILSVLRPEKALELSCDDIVDPKLSLVASETAGVDGVTCNTAGTGKGLLMSMDSPMFSRSPVAPEDLETCFEPRCTKILTQAAYAPEGWVQLAEGASYDTTDLLPQGVHKMKFMRGTSQQATASDVVILDSCFGMKDVLTSLERASPIDSISNAEHMNNTVKQPLMAEKPRKLIAVWGPNPLYFDLIQYSGFSASDMALLPYVLGYDPALESHFPLVKEHEALLKTLKSGGLCQCCGDDLSHQCMEGRFNKSVDCASCSLEVSVALP